MFSLKIIPTPVEIPRLVLTFDDGYATAYSEGFAYANALGIKGTMYVITNLLNTTGYMTTTQLLEMNAAGWDIGNHTMSHAFSQTDNLTQAQMEAEFSGAAAVLDGLGLTRASRHVAYPGGQHTTAADAAMLTTGMLTGRTTQPSNDCLPSMCRRIWLPGKQLGEPTTLATAKGYIDAAIASNRTVIIFMHEIVASPSGANQWSIAKLQSLIDYVIATGIRCLTISELYNVIVNS